jgi:hypothetical protein
MITTHQDLLDAVERARKHADELRDHADGSHALNELEATLDAVRDYVEEHLFDEDGEPRSAR